MSSVGQILIATRYPNLYTEKYSGIYYARIMTAGKATKKSLKTMEIGEALAKLAALLADTGSPELKISSLSWLAAVELYLNRELQRPELKERAKDSIEFFAGHAKGFVKKDIQISLISADYCRGWWEATAQRYAASTANGILNFVRAVFRVAQEVGAIQNDPTLTLKRMPVRRGKLNVPSRENFRRIVDEVRRAASLQIKKGTELESCPTADMIEFLAYSGCRVGEAVLIKWGDVRGDLLDIPSNKHAREWRVLPINNSLQTVIDRIRKYSKGDHILQIKSPAIALGNACKRLGIPHVRVHDLRHYFATTAIESGVDIPTVAKWLGHRDGGALAMRVYGHLRDEHSRESAKKLMF